MVTALLPVLILAWAVLPGCSASATDTPPRTVDVRIDGRPFKLELALTPEQRYEGLSDRPSIADDGGMFFAFPIERELGFVMRRCLVPIDLIYLDSSGRVVRMHQMQVEPYDAPEAELPVYRSEWPARFAIEIQGGTLDELDVQRGDRIALPTEKLKRWAR